jgi:creatinine amidohydrolase
MLDATWATSPEAGQQIARRPLAVLAFGAQEQHGPHLPLCTDTLLAGELARRIAAALDALLLPPVAYGETWNTSGYPGTVSLSFATVQALLLDIGCSMKAQEVRALIVVNGHFGNRAPLELAARTLATDYRFPVLLLDYPGLEALASEICDSAPAAPTFYHADEVETSMALAVQPDAVRMERAVAEYPVFPSTFGAEPVKLDTFCASGVFGDPRGATAAKGEQLFAGLCVRCVAVATAFLDRHQLN